MKKLTTYFNHSIAQHIVFWLLVFCCYSISNAANFDTKEELIITYSFKIGLQIMVAYICLYGIVPRFLAKENKLELGIFLSVLFLLLNWIVITWRMGFLEPTYPITHATCIQNYQGISYWQRVFDYKNIFFNMPASYCPPAFVLIAIQYYQKQQQIAAFNEQKKSAELTVLKNQLNPHFLFNTLNNLYSLAIKKSDKTPEVIGKLSDMLDYMLYRCNDKFVPLNKEIKLIENYLALEKIRYGKRVAINFNTAVKEEVKIAPLLLLTFIENAFKHGVRPQLEQATIDIDLTTKAQGIAFCIKNSVPTKSPNYGEAKEAIGLKNVKTQLDLLYPDAHALRIEASENSYAVKLNIRRCIRSKAEIKTVR